jgi:hypothetical protein
VSPWFHISRRRASVVHLDITTKVRISRVRVYKGNSIWSTNKGRVVWGNHAYKNTNVCWTRTSRHT